MITTILFDLGGVVFIDGTKAFINYMHENYGVDKEKLKEIFSTGPVMDLYRAGKMTQEEYWKEVQKELDLPEPIEVLEKKWYDGYELMIETKEIIKKLRKKYQVYFLSDNMKHRSVYVEKRFNMFEFFHGGTYSYETGRRKPHPEVYQFALQKMNVTPDQVIFIDDKEKNLLPAKELGMQTLLFTSPEQLEKDLQEMHLL